MEQWIIDVVTAFGYVGVFFLMLAENLFPPIPSEVIVPVAGLAVGAGTLSLTGVVVAALAGTLIGNLPPIFFNVLSMPLQLKLMTGDGFPFPVIGLVQVGTQAIADRYTYVPLVGIFVMLAWGVPELLRSRREILPWAAGATVAALTTLTVVQAGYWKDTRTLFQHAIDVSGNLAGFRSSLGYALQSEGKIDEAIAEYREALRLDPEHMPAIIDRQPPQPGDVPQTYADISKARAALHYDPKTQIEEGLRRFVEWFRMRGL